MAQFKSPTGPTIRGTLETVSGVALVSSIDPKTGEVEYEGDTEIFWDEQKTVARDGKVIFVDTIGDEWTFDQLVPEDDEAEEE